MTTLKNMIVFTANRLSDGEVVWLGAHEKWVETINSALVVKTESERDAAAAIAEAADANNVVVEPYPIDVILEAGQVEAVKFREKIRATGPTIRLDLGKQADVTASAA